MTIGEIYKLAIQMGIRGDPRPRTRIKKILDREKKNFQNLKGIERKVFDRERLENPYADTRILFGKPDASAKKILVGVDIGPGEIALAAGLPDIDLVISHHPLGRALARRGCAAS